VDEDVDHSGQTQQVVESLNEGVVVLDADGRITTVNRTARRLLGTERGHQIDGGAPVAADRRISYADGTPIDPMESPIRQVLRTREPMLGLLVRMERGGEARWLEVNIQPLPDGGAVSSFTDVTERRRADEEQRRLAEIVESTDDAVLSKDRELRIMSWNRGAERLYGYTAEEAIGQSIRILIPEELLGEEVEILESVLAENLVTKEETVRVRKDGTRVDVSLTVSPIRDAAGQVVGASVIGRDISGRKRAERALREAHDRAQRYLDMAGSIIVAIGSDERVTMINRAGLAILGLRDDEVIGQNWFDLVFPEDVREPLRLEFRRAVESEVWDEALLGYYETPLLTSTGERRIVGWQSAALHDDGEGLSGLLSSGTDITERLKSEEAVAHLAYHDQLTGLPNRALLEEHLHLAVARGDRERSQLALLYVDLDNFKLVNDSLGHAAGDRLLEMVAERIDGVVRSSDLVARQGGDEFLVLLTDVQADGAAAAENVARKILTALEEPFRIGAAEFEIGASVGIAAYPSDGSTPSELLRAADSAMYQAKAAGRSRYALHRSGSARSDQLAMTARLRRAIAQEELLLHYQPIFTVPDRRLSAVEALLRWNDPERGLVPPGGFIQLAEDTGLIEPIGEWVIRAICRQALDWSAAGLGAGVRIHFNLSPRQLRQRRAVEAIREVVQSDRIPPGTLTAEITESAVMAEADHGRTVLNELRHLGLHLSVDDFGSGYSSLGRLRQLPVDELKLDRSFLRGVPHDAEAGGLVRAVIDLASGLGMDTVVEGVETAGQWNFLAEHGHLLAQGFHLARPAPADEITAMLRDARAAG
jgi:diguanylate cyclase (GGDEF)-like protein/PAS domain S-box-containing protein